MTTETAPNPETEPTAIRVPGFAVTWPKVATLAGAIILSVGGGFWGLSNALYQGLKEKIDHNEAKGDSLDSLTATIREAVAKQGAQLTALDKSVNQLTDQIKMLAVSVNDTRDRVIAIDVKISERGTTGATKANGEERGQH